MSVSAPTAVAHAYDRRKAACRGAHACYARAVVVRIFPRLSGRIGGLHRARSGTVLVTAVGGAACHGKRCHRILNTKIFWGGRGGRWLRRLRRGDDRRVVACAQALRDERARGALRDRNFLIYIFTQFSVAAAWCSPFAHLRTCARARRGPRRARHRGGRWLDRHRRCAFSGTACRWHADELEAWLEQAAEAEHHAGREHLWAAAAATATATAAGWVMGRQGA